MIAHEMDYKGYRAVISYDDDDELFYGDVVDLNDTIVFHGRSVDELNANFRAVVDAYLDSCRDSGDEPDRPYSGKIQLRMGSALHRRLAGEAAVNKLSLNEWIVRQLESHN